MRVTATATRTGQWWAIEVSDLAGGLHTQARRLDQVASAVIDAVALVADVSPDAIEVDVIPRLPQAEADLTETARNASQEAAQAAERASRLSRQAVEQLRSQGLTVRDVWQPARRACSTSLPTAERLNPHPSSVYAGSYCRCR